MVRPVSFRLSISVVLAVLASACSDSPARRDGGVISFDARARTDALPPEDAAEEMDAGGLPDATPAQDARPDPDAAESDPDATELDATESPDAMPDPDAAEPLDAEEPDAEMVVDSGAGVDSGAAPDANPSDASAAVDAGFADAGFADAADPDAAPVDSGPPDSGVIVQGGSAVISEFLAVSSSTDWFEVTNIGSGAIALETYSVRISSRSALGALPIYAAGDPTGSLGLAVTVAANAAVWGVPNPPDPADIPAGANFVFGAPGAVPEDAFSDAGDILTVSLGTLGDILDFTQIVTDPAVPLAAGDFPIVLDIPTSLAPGSLTPPANDPGSAWCVHIFRPATPGAVNRSCNAFVISEVSYDYDSLTTGVDDGQEFIELAGPGGGPIQDLLLTRVEASGVAAGTVDGEYALPAVRAPLDGLYVVADDIPGMGGITYVSNADLVINLVMENGPDAVQLIYAPPGLPPALQDALAYGTGAAGLVDTTRSLPASEGTGAPDPTPTNYTVDLARPDDEADTGNNGTDFRYDPTPTPGVRNGAAAFAITSITPDDAVVGTTASILIRGTDFTDGMTVAFTQMPAPAPSCTTPAPDVLSCSVAYPSGGSGVAERIEVVVAQRSEAGGSAALPDAFTWTTANNETNVGTECDFCNLQFPATIIVTAGVETPLIFGQIYEAGLTDVTAGGPAPGILAEVGYGPASSDPRALNWTWAPAVFNVETGASNNNDEYRGSFTVPTAGSYSYTYRFSLDGGLTWSYADLGGAGSNGGLDFSPAATGVLTVN